MELLQRAYGYNRRANEVLAGQLSQLTPEQRANGPAGITMSPDQFFAHLVLVDWAFLGIASGRQTGPRPGDEGTVASLAPQLAEIDAGWEAFLADADAATMSSLKLVPWFGKELSVEDIALQCLLHSHQHRTDLRWALYHYGNQTPDTDYIIHVLGYDIAAGPPDDAE